MRLRTLLRGCALAALLSCGACQPDAKAAPAGGPPPPTVLVMNVVRKDIPIFSEAVATIDGYVNADIRARVRGYLASQTYKEGGFVKANQRMFTIEPTEYENALATAQANLARAKAVAERNRVQLQRDRELFKTGATSQQAIDNATASASDADAQVEGAKAQLQQAQLNLSYTQVRSPIDGIAGVASVRVGNLVGQEGPTLLTTVSQIDPIRVNFPISEREYVKSPERFKELEKRDLSWARKQFETLKRGELAEHDDPGLELVLSDGSVYPYKGIVVTVARQIDASTGTLALQALFPNPDRFLRPGQYGRVRMRRANEGKNAIAVPDKALIAVQGTYSVAVVGDDDKVQLRRVQVGDSVNGERLIEDGLKEGERVVVEGTQKVSDGAKVKPQQAPPPRNETARAEPRPTPAQGQGAGQPQPQATPQAH
jgi:membrane fusion protein (multidrug efflux system)